MEINISMFWDYLQSAS